VGNGIAQVRPFGVDVSSGVESSPGRKDPVLLRRFMDEVRQAAASLGSGSYEEDSGTPYDWMDE
jgi:phosphoribosylanthranilate isomerase